MNKIAERPFSMQLILVQRFRRALMLIVLCATAARAVPDITLGSGELTYVEMSDAVLVDPALLLTSAATIVRAEITIKYIAGTPQPQADVLAAINLNGLTVSAFTASTLTVTGISSAANYQGVLRTLTFINPSESLSGSRRGVEYKITDSDGGIGFVTRNINVQLINNPPRVSIARPELNYAEGDGDMYVADGATILDSDSVTVKEIRIQIVSGFMPGQFGDKLEARISPEQQTDSQGNLVGLQQSYDTSTGLLYIRQVDGDSYETAAMQRLLNSVAFSNPSQDPVPGDRVLSFVVSDNAGFGPVSNVTVHFVAVNQAPVITMTTSPLSMVEGESVIIAADLTISDIDNRTLVAARVAVSGAFEPLEDVLACQVEVEGVTCSYSPSTGVLDITGDANLTTYQLVLNNVAYTTVGGASLSGARDFTLTINDGASTSAPVVRRVNLVAVNNAPVLAGPTEDKGYNGRGPEAIMPLLNVTDGDDVTLRAAEVRVVEGYDAATDALGPLAVFGVPTLEVAWDPAAAVLSFAGVATPAQFTAALRAVYIVHSAASLSIKRRFTFTASDGASTSVPLSVNRWALDFAVLPEIVSSTDSQTAGELVTVTGRHFGPRVNPVVNFVQIGGEACTGVTMIVDDTQLTCTAPAGTGANVSMSIRVNDVDSFNYLIFRYKPPVVLAATSTPTQGGSVTVTGQNFGVVGSSNIGAVYIGGVLCRGATVTTPHSQIVCTGAEGAGKDVTVTVSIALQGSGDSGVGKFAFLPPTIASITNGSHAGFLATIVGTNFGPAGTAYAAVSFEESSLWNTTGDNLRDAEFSCSEVVVTVPHSVLTCMVPPMFASALGPQKTDLDLRYTPIVHVANQFTGKSNATAAFASMRYLASTITNVSRVSMWGGFVTVNGTHLGPAGTAVSLQMGSTVNATDFTVSSSTVQWTAPAVTVTDTTAYVYVPDYITTGALMAPYVRLAIGSVTTNHVLPQLPLYEGPVVTGESSGSHFGDCTGTCVNTDHIVTVVGRNFAPDFNYSADVHQTRQYSVYNLTYASVAIDGATGARSSYQVDVFNSTYMTFRSTPAGRYTQLTSQGATLTVSMMCAGSLATCQDSGSTGVEKFAFTGPQVDSVSSTATVGGEITIKGKFFGNNENVFFNETAYPEAGIKVCANSACSVFDACNSSTANSRSDTRIRCTLVGSSTAGTAYSADLVVTQGNMSGTCAGCYSYSAPLLANVSSAPAAGGLVTVNGQNFGAYPGALALTVTGTSSTFSCSNFVFLVPHYQFTCLMEAGMGFNMPATVTITSYTGATQSVTKSIGFSYEPPKVFGCSVADTAGGLVTITGQSFGTNVSLVTAYVDGVLLNGTSLTSDGVLVGYTTGGGTGVLNPVYVIVDSQTSNTANVFNYSAPSITAVLGDPPGMFGASTITLEGANFGAITTNATLISLDIGGSPTCTASSCSVSTANTVVTCATSGCGNQSCGVDARNLTLTIDSQSSGISGHGLLVFGRPIITSVYGSVTGTSQRGYLSFFAQSYDKLVIVGKNFGSAGPTILDGSFLDYAYFCEKSSTELCSGADWVDISSTLKKSLDNVRLNVEIPPNAGENHTIVVSFGGYNTTTTGSAVIKGYLGPAMTSFTPTSGITTAGGLMVAFGERFGPINDTYISNIIWGVNDNPVLYAASDLSARVQTENAEIAFIAPEGVGTKSFQIRMTNGAGDYGTTEALTMTYDRPILQAASDVPVQGGTLTITGKGFGPLGSAFVSDVVVNNAFNCTGTVVTVAHTTLTCTMPAGTGVRNILKVYVDGQMSIILNAATFDYAAPVISAVPSIPTDHLVEAHPAHQTLAVDAAEAAAGPWLTVLGLNFGEANSSLGSVTVGGAACLYPRVTVYDVEVRCLLGSSQDGSGAGAGYDVSVVRASDNQANTSAAIFSYLAPVISFLSPASFFGDELVTVTGSNFGCTSDFAGNSSGCVLPVTATPNITARRRLLAATSATASINGVAATNLTVVSHSVITFLPPDASTLASVLNLDFAINVQGQLLAGRKYSYSTPTILSVSEASVFGGTVTVTGRNFGPVGSANILQVIVAQKIQDLSFAQPRVTVAGSEIEFKAPAGRGVNFDVTIQIATQTTGSSGQGLLEYAGPRVESVTGASTAGGVATITGRNFGPVGGVNINQLTVAQRPCLDATVTVENVRITCTVGPGSGGPYDVFLRISDETDLNTGLRKYNYSVPVVERLEPLNAAPGEVVTIVGDSFGDDISKVAVTVGANACGNLSYAVNHTALLCTTPYQTGFDFALFVTVDGLTSAPGAFSYAAPNVTSATSAPVMGGAVTVFGKNFGPAGSANVDSVFLGSSPCLNPTVQVADSAIVCTASEALIQTNGGTFLRSDLDGDGYMDVNVTISGQTSGASGNGAYRFQACTVQNINPYSAVYGGELVTVVGTNFGSKDNRAASGDVLAVRVAGQSALAGAYRMMSTDTTFSFGMPYSVGQHEDFALSINGRECDVSAVAALAIAYGPPVVSRALGGAPPPTRGGAAVFGGKGFGPVGTAYLERVLVGGRECADARVTMNDVQITCTVGAGEGNNLDVEIFASGRSSGDSGRGAFQYAEPVVSFALPNFITMGTKLQIFGENFGTSATRISVLLMGVAHAPGQGFSCDSVELGAAHERVLCTVGAGVGSSVRVLMTVGGVNMTGNFTPDNIPYNLTFNKPFIDTVTPSRTEGGSVNGPVRIVGGNFGPSGSEWSAFFDRTPTLGGAPCTDATVVVDNTAIECLPPPGVGRDLDVDLQMGGLNAYPTGTRKFRYIEPVITSMSSLPTSGGVATIIGFNFGPPSLNATVRIFTAERCAPGQTPSSFYGSAGCDAVQGLGAVSNVVVLNHTKLSCLVPAGTGKQLDVRVFLKGQNSGETGDDAFAFRPPVVTSVSPRVQPLFAPDNLLLTIRGQNFGRSPEDVGKVDVLVGQRYCNRSSIRVVPPMGPSTETEIFAQPPFGAGVDLPVVVEVDGQRSEVVPQATFSYFAPVVQSVEPVPTLGGTATISGDNFGPVGDVFQVLIGEAACTGARVTVEDKQIECEAPPGTGSGLDVFVRIANGTSNINSADSGVAVFRYQSPVITLVRPLTAKAGAAVTVTGRNFGASAARVRLDFIKPQSLGGYAAGVWSTTDVTMLQPHEMFRATVPVGFGTALQVLVMVDGQYPDNWNTTQPFLFDYNAPQILEAVPVPTSGGTLVLRGTDMGSTAPGAVDLVSVRTWTQEVLTCASPVVTVSSQEVQCQLPSGSGTSLDVQISVGGQLSDWERVFSFEYPVIENVFPTEVAMNDQVTIVGRNFGDDASLIALTFAGTRAPPEAFFLAENHTRIVFSVPLGTGPQKGFTMRLPVDPVTGSARNAQDSVNAISSGNTSSTVSYLPPVVFNTTSARTRGGNVTVEGTNFGPVGTRFLQSVLIANKPCLNPEVTANNSRIVCAAQAGAGKELAVVVVVDQLTSPVFAGYSYEAPVVERIFPSRGFPGDRIVIEGTSFGTNPGDVVVTIGGAECINVVMEEEHVRIACDAGVAEGKNRSVVVTVKGVQGPLLSSVRFVYQKAGCLTKGAENYDPAVTDQDGSCKVLGCTQAEASNFNPFANVNDGTCVREPEVVSMKVKLDFQEYLARPEYYDNLFLDDVAAQLGVARERLVMTDVTDGSTVFLFQILDDPDDRAQDVTLRLEQKVLANEWSMAAFTLVQLKWEDSPRGTVDTKSDEPRVSTASIIALVSGGVIVILFGAFWRKALVQCSQFCCGDEYQEDVEQQLMMEGMLDAEATKKPTQHVPSGKNRATVTPVALGGASGRA